MKIVVDENIVAAAEMFSGVAEVQAVNGRQLTAAQLSDADALIVRSVTKVNAKLLDATPVRFVGSTTIGVDHLDTNYLNDRSVYYCNAPGSNADSVVDYVLSVMCTVEGLLEQLYRGGQVGIIGLGNVGRRLSQRLCDIGIRCVAYDPLLDQSSSPLLGSLAKVLQSDMVCVHTPLTVAGDHPTQGLLDCQLLSHLPAGAVLLNAGRGEVLENAMLLEFSRQRPDIKLVLDVWQGEPGISRKLLSRCRLATPHIAGYSLDGKILGLQMVAEQLFNYFGLPVAGANLDGVITTPSERVIQGEDEVSLIREAVLACYDVTEDDQRLREAAAAGDLAENFDLLRKHYPRRRELRVQPFSMVKDLPNGANLLRALRGRV